jgi:hypothetical protein
MYLPQKALSIFANGMTQFFSFVTYCHFILVGSICHPRLSPPRTRKLPDLSDLPLFVQEEEKAHIVHPVEETVTAIAVRKRKVHRENIGHNLLV